MIFRKAALVFFCALASAHAFVGPSFGGQSRGASLKMSEEAALTEELPVPVRGIRSNEKLREICY
jgi:hypothetical protein